MKEKVIKTVGEIWKTLGEKGECSVAQLATALKTPEDITNQAIGWLAREDKIQFIKKGSRCLIALIDSERKAYEATHQEATSVR